MTKGPLALAGEVAAVLDELSIPYALGGSLASSLFGEPRATVDVDLAVEVAVAQGPALLDRLAAGFYVPRGAAATAIEVRASFNVVDTEHGLKVDLFVLGGGVLDRSQLARRVLVPVSEGASLWVTAPEDQVLRKLDWFRQGGGASERQWRDVIGILRLHRGTLDVDHLWSTAGAVGLRELLEAAVEEARPPV